MALPEPNLTEIEVIAIRALVAGAADPQQQRIGMNAIGAKFCRVHDSPFVANGRDSETFVALGRHQVGVMIASVNNPNVLAEAQARDRGEPLRSRPTRRNRQ